MLDWSLPQMTRRWLLPLGCALVFAARVQAQEQAPLSRFAVWQQPSLEGGNEEGERDEIETDRDSFTPATKLVGRGRFLLESAYSFIDNRRVKDTHSFPEILCRYGLTDRLELRFGANYEVGGAGNDVSGIDAGDDDSIDVRGLERETRVTYGLKFAVTDPAGWIPRSAVVLQGFTPTSGKATDSSFVGAYVVGWELPHRWVFDAAIRYATASAEEDHFSTWAPSVVLKVPVGDKWNVHAEYFGIFASGREHDFVRHYFSPGAHYLLTSNLELGVRVGWGLNDQSARFFANVGMGYRF